MNTTSVIVPAHNEARVIGRCLDALLKSASRDEFDVVVVANGCTDDTAAVANRYSPEVVVIETAVASKAHALNLGDRKARSYPRLYVDADVELTTEGVRCLTEALDTGTALAAAPEIQVDTSGCTRVVRSYMRIWTALPIIREGLVGRGVYALSQEGRSRFGDFPDLIADDLFVHSRFAPSERICLRGCQSVVRVPRTVRDLIRQKSRVQAGNQQLRQTEPTVASTRFAWASAALGRPQLLPSLPVYLAISLAIRLSVAGRRLARRHRHWLRDERARSGV